MVDRRLLGLGMALLAGTAQAATAIHLDQLGFAPRDIKRVVIADPSRRPVAWTLVDEAGKPVASGRTAVKGDDPVSGDHVHVAELGTAIPAGRYRLRAGDATSRPFAISARPFASLADATLNYFYQTRAGIPIVARFAGGARWARAAGHPHEIAPCFSGADQAGNVWPGCGAYRLDVTGGWYDAGDQGKYVVNGGIATWTLQNLYERGQRAGAAPFPDGSAHLPEAGNGWNDLLDEARWEMRFLLAMQVPDGVQMKVPVGPQPKGQPLRFTAIDAGGMAHHKVSDLHWTGLPTIPAEDKEPRVLFPPSTAATLNLAATAAQCARIWRTIDAPFADRCLMAARRAYAAALRNPEVFAPETFTGSGSYGDTKLADEFFWATAELYATTRAPALAEALRHAPAFTAPVAEPGWGGTAALGTITLATTPGLLTPAEHAAERRLIVDAAEGYLAEAQRSPYQIPFASGAYSWGSNGVLMNRAMVLGVAADLTGEARFRQGMVDTLDYVLGRNPLDQSFVSGFGWKPLEHPHHRFWAHQLDPNLPGPPPGVMSGGPNSTSFADPVAATLKGCAPMRCWVDDIRAYAMNEEAINWNAPLLWVAAYLDAGRPSDARR